MNITRQTLRLLAAIVIAGVGLAGAAVSAAEAKPIPLHVTSEAGSNAAPRLSIDKLQATFIMKSVHGAAAHAAPLRGHPVPRIGKVSSRMIKPAASAQSLSYFGGPVVKSATMYNLYVNSNPATFGYPGSFITDNAIHGADQFFHATDQYVGANANDRYNYGGFIEPSYDTSSTLHDADIYNIINAASNYYGDSGYGAIYNVFLPPGVTECSNAAGGCYGTAPFTFCAYHGSVDIWTANGPKHLLYSVEPFQNISGCNAPTSNLSDSTASTFSHEIAETITDPDLNAWFNPSYGEIGDLCRLNYGELRIGSAGTFFNRTFNIQEEWLNDAANGNGDCGF